MKYIYVIIACLAIGLVVIPATGDEVIIPSNIQQKINTETAKVKVRVPLNKPFIDQNKQLFRTWVSGSIDLTKATKRVSRRFNRTTFGQKVTRIKPRLLTERLKLISRTETPTGGAVSPVAQPRAKVSAQPQAKAKVRYTSGLQLEKVKALQLKTPMQIIYREGPMYFRFQKLREVRAEAPLQKSVAVQLGKNFLLNNSFIRETNKDKIGAVYVQERRINEERGERQQPVDYLVQQDLVFERHYEGKPVLNSKAVIGIFPGTKEIVLFKHFNWTPLEEQKIQKISPQMLRSVSSATGSEIANRLQQKIRKYSGKFTRAEVKQVIPAWFQTEESLIPVLAFEIFIEYPSPKGPWSRTYLEVINLAGSDDIFFKERKAVQRPREIR